ncbi:hypothetical protein [Nocardia abscessus]|uniref:hypothetical protein n=1 Tax=Nocardia abscessus TaxID=120957 RepID=UPI0024566C1B|nr:hypothetical protein [Nocardia abscessus]
MAGHRDTAHGSAPTEVLSRTDFADRVLRAAATPERIADVVAQIVGERIEIGPVPVALNGLVHATAIGEAGPVHAVRCDSGDWDMTIAVPILLRLRVRLPGRTLRYIGAARVLIRLALIPREPCGLFIRTDDVRAEDLTVRMRARDLTSQVVGRLGRVESVVAAHILRYIDDLFAGPEFSGVRDIDIAHIIERAWDAGLVLDFPDRAAS